jgi:hypothetical protein
MRSFLLMRGACASAAATLLFSLGFASSLAHAPPLFGSPAMRPGIVHSHGQAPGWRNRDRRSWAWRSRSPLGRNGWFWNQGGIYGSGFWFSPYAYADTGSATGGGPLVVIGAPALNVFPAAATDNFDQSSEGGCVIHKLIYDRAGKYLGERQTPEC